MFLDAQLFSVKELKPFSQDAFATLPTEVKLSIWEVIFPKRGLPSSPTTQTDPFDPVNNISLSMLRFTLISWFCCKKRNKWGLLRYGAKIAGKVSIAQREG
jgi:hypothetical protein